MTQRQSQVLRRPPFERRETLAQSLHHVCTFRIHFSAMVSKIVYHDRNFFLLVRRASIIFLCAGDAVPLVTHFLHTYFLFYLVPVVLRLVRTVDVDADVLRLVLTQLREPH